MSLRSERQKPTALDHNNSKQISNGRQRSRLSLEPFHTRSTLPYISTSHSIPRSWYLLDCFA